MFECVCGRSFKYQSGLSRHQHGNLKQGVKECSEYYEYLEVKREAEKARYIAKQTKVAGHIEAVKAVVDHTPSEFPDYVPRNKLKPLLLDNGTSVEKRKESTGLRTVERTLVRLVPHYFKTIYMDIKHPENWSVVLQNISSWDMKVRRDGAWLIEPFRDWAADFTSQCTLGYIRETEAEEDVVQVFAIALQSLDQVREEIYKALRREVSDEDMRHIIKDHHNFK